MDPANSCDSRRVCNYIAARLQSYKQIIPGFMGDMATYWDRPKATTTPSGPTNAQSTEPTSQTSLLLHRPLDLRPNQDVYKYFRQGLELRVQCDLYTGLAKAGILPGSKPDMEEMHKAIEAAFGVNAQTSCEDEVLNEVWMYFNVKNGNQYVPAGPKYPGSCRRYIPYPVKKRGSPVRPPSPPPGQPPPQVPPPPVATTKPMPTRTATTTRLAGPIRAGVQTGTCSSEGATVCVNPEGSKQFSNIVELDGLSMSVGLIK